MSRFASLAVDIREGCLPIPVDDNVAFAQGAPVQVSGQVLQGRLAFTDMLTVNNPFFRQACREVVSTEQPGFIQASEHSGAKYCRQIFLLEQMYDS